MKLRQYAMIAKVCNDPQRRIPAIRLLSVARGKALLCYCYVPQCVSLSIIFALSSYDLESLFLCSLRPTKPHLLWLEHRRGLAVFWLTQFTHPRFPLTLVCCRTQVEMIFAFYYGKENPALCSSGSDTSAPISLKKMSFGVFKKQYNHSPKVIYKIIIL